MRDNHGTQATKEKDWNWLNLYVDWNWLSTYVYWMEHTFPLKLIEHICRLELIEFTCPLELIQLICRLELNELICQLILIDYISRSILMLAVQFIFLINKLWWSYYTTIYDLFLSLTSNRIKKMGIIQHYFITQHKY